MLLKQAVALVTALGNVESHALTALCCLKPMPETTKGEDKAKVLMEYFEE